MKQVGDNRFTRSTARIFSNPTQPNDGSLAPGRLIVARTSLSLPTRWICQVRVNCRSHAEADDLVSELENEPERIGNDNKPAWLAHTIYERVSEKLKREPVEDFRIDFEDGYGNRPDSEEDGHAEEAATEVAEGIKNGTLPPFIGIRIKPFNEELRARSFRTLDIFVSTLAEKSEAKLPTNFDHLAEDHYSGTGVDTCCFAWSTRKQNGIGGWESEV